ncbi:hypothetical protein CDIK_1089 [Cucumispora dikerogammari]|nr:hypothetical protein CDIK_1089 [Cucumispora dikerogammari]
MININTTRLGERYQMDLINLTKHAEHNEGFKYIFNIIAVFSFFNMAVKVKNKTANEIITNLKNICYHYDFPFILQYDNGKEFVNAKKEEFLKNYKITKKNSRLKTLTI